MVNGEQLFMASFDVSLALSEVFKPCCAVHAGNVVLGVAPARASPVVRHHACQGEKT